MLGYCFRVPKHTQESEVSTVFEKFTRDIAIDFGTASVLVYVQGQGIVLKEPSVVAIDVSTDRVVKVGQDAMEMLGRTPDHIDALRPMKNGTISQYEVTLQMLRYFIRRACGKGSISLLLPNYLIE